MGLQTKLDICKRICALKYMLLRSDLEGVLKYVDEDNSKAVAKLTLEQIVNAIENTKLKGYLSKKELELHNKPAGSWEEQDITNGSWRKESLMVLLWSIGLWGSIPSYGELVNSKELSSMIKPIRYAESILDEADIKKPEILHQRDIAELWHWRSRTSKMIIENTVPEGLTKGKLLEICKESAQRSYEEDNFPAPINDDYAILGKAYKELTPEEYVRSTSIAMERHYAFNWLSKYSDDWDKVPTDT